MEEKHRHILQLIAAGYDYKYILDAVEGAHPRDIYDAAQNALDIIDCIESRKARKEQRREKLYPRSGSEWEEHEILTLRRSFETKTEPSIIAKQLGRSRGAIRTQLIKMGLIHPNWHEQAKQKYARHGTPWSKEEQNEVKSLFQSGLSLDEIASKYQRSAYAIRMQLEKMGLIEREKLSKP